MTLKIFIWLIRLMPHRFALSFGRFAGKLLRIVLRRKTDRCEARCVLSLGVGVTVAREIIKESFMNLGMSAIEFIRIPKIKSRINEFVSFPPESVAVFREAVSRGKGVIIMSAHMGNWELSAVRIALEGFRYAPIYTSQRNQGGVNDIIMNIRELTPEMTFINSNNLMRDIFRILKSGGIIAILQDLDARKNGVITNFLGLPASTHDGIVKLYRKFKSPVVPLHFIRDKNNPAHHFIIVPEILSDRKDKNGLPFGEDLQGSLDICNETIEDWIKERPGQWMWLMDRWEYTLGKNV